MGVVFRQRWRASGTTMDRGLFLLFLFSSVSSFFPPHPRSTESMILEAGYEAEAHKVVTDDDYILTVYRIVGTGPVIFLQHGMVGSSPRTRCRNMTCPLNSTMCCKSRTRRRFSIWA